MNDPVAPQPEPERRPMRGKWVLLAFLAALAAFMYVSIMIKIVKYGP